MKTTGQLLRESASWIAQESYRRAIQHGHRFGWVGRCECGLTEREYRSGKRIQCTKPQGKS